MGVFDFEENRLRQQEIEVRALVALLNCDDKNVREDALIKLCKYAFPECVAKEINEEKSIDDYYKEAGKEMSEFNGE